MIYTEKQKGGNRVKGARHIQQGGPSPCGLLGDNSGQKKNYYLVMFLVKTSI